MIQISENLFIRLFTSEDATNLFKLINENREVLRQWLPWIDMNTAESASLDFIENTLGNQWGIFYKDNLVGVVGLPYCTEDKKEVTIGYWLSPQVWGLGIMTCVCKKFIDHLYDNGTEIINVFVANINKKSLNVIKKLGFEITGLKEDGEHLLGEKYDQIVFNLTKKAYLKQKEFEQIAIQELSKLLKSKNLSQMSNISS